MRGMRQHRNFLPNRCYRLISRVAQGVWHRRHEPLHLATWLVNSRARWYDAATGRWLSKDPIGLSGGLNLYAFCGNNSLNYIDYNGWNVHYSASNGGAEGGGGGGHSIVWVDKPDSKSKDETVSFEFGPSTPNVLGGPTVVISGVQKGHSGSDISILTTPEQDAAAIDKINDIKNERPPYWYPFRNCADMARDVLNAAGLNLPSRIIDTPAKLLNDLKKVDR